MINMKNTEQASAVYALVVSAVFAFLSFYNTDAETYLFPRIIAVVLAILSVILFISNSAAGDNTESSDSGHFFTDIWPGLIVGFILLLVMEDLGFYTSSFLAFLAVLILYGNRGISDMKVMLTKVGVSAGFLLVLYLLFWNGLHVRTPTGILF